MESLYRSPMRVYLTLAIFSLIGIWAATQLPVSLFPNSTKPEVSSCLNIELSPEAFLRQYGATFEEKYRAINRGNLKVEKVVATYRPADVCFDISFAWGGDPQEAIREVDTVSTGLLASLPDSYRDTHGVWINQENSGFLALSFYSPERSLTELYRILDPAFSSQLASVEGAGEAVIWNPQRREILIELKPESLAALGLLPRDVARAFMRVFDAYDGGSLTIGESQLRVEFPRGAAAFEELRMIPVPTQSGRVVTLGDIATLDLAVPVDDGQVFKTSGSSSVLLWASPKPGGNIKKMAEDVRAIVDRTMPNLPKDIEYRVLVDPSEFIRSAVNNVAKEVGLAAGLAVIILFIFIGSFRNVATAAIEIPLSLVLAFIMMKLSGMNLNLISLGGLALSAGMNVDASVVVMENIFRHFDTVKGKILSFDEKVKLVAGAVKEVQFSVIASTIASLVVFLPLALTSDLTYAILGDLAKAVVFSHGFSAIVALVLVPTIRLQLMKSTKVEEEHSRFEPYFLRLEAAYSRALGKFLATPKIKYATYGGLAALMLYLGIAVGPRLPREIIGKPDTDWLVLGVNTSGNTMVKQMEAHTEGVENELLTKFGDQIAYTFTQIRRANNATIMFRLKDKRDMEEMLKKVEEAFPNTPEVSYWADSWNPAELPVPDPPDLRVVVRGQEPSAMAETTRDIINELREGKIFERIRNEPNAALEESILVRPKLEQWPLLAANGLTLTVSDLADLTRTATLGKSVGKIGIRDESGVQEQLKVRLRFPQDYIADANELGALPIGAGQRIIPLKALATVSREEVLPSIRRENGTEMFVVTARGKQSQDPKDRAETKESVRRAEELIRNWPTHIAQVKAKRLALTSAPAQQAAEAGASATGTSGAEPTGSTEVVADGPASDAKQQEIEAVAQAAQASKEAVALAPSVQLDDPKKELTDALWQLGIAISLSIALIFLTMVFQFGSLMNAALVLVAVPLGFIGVLLSLTIFGSTLSLNSMLGVILLNGLAVANSIILVDFLQRKVKDGAEPRYAAVEVARVRLRPILMTSLTTGLGMLPIALGLGEGGRILQPLGIAVAGGLAFSMVTTLFIVPALQVSWLEYQAKRRAI